MKSEALGIDPAELLDVLVDARERVKFAAECDEANECGDEALLARVDRAIRALRDATSTSKPRR